MLWLIFTIFVLISAIGLFKTGNEGGVEKIRMLLWVFGAIGIFGFIFTTTITIPAGNAGVVYDPFAGGVQKEELKEGLHFVAPWKEITTISMRTQTYNMHTGGDDISLPTLTAEGLEVQIDVSVIYHIKTGSASDLYQNVGEDYQEILIKPITRATVRDLVAQDRAEDLYATDKRVVLQSNLKTKIEAQLENRGIEIEAVLIRDIQLPNLIKAAIESKLEAEQQAKQMEFVLDKEQKEAQRKVIEATGEAQKVLIDANATAQSQKIIASSLNDQYIKWFWISTLKDQKSVYYVPTGSDGLPLFKNVQ